jgi:hypothetical protein
MRLIAALLLVLAGCFEPRYDEGIACSELGACPPGMTCDPMSNRCWSGSRPGVCGDGEVNTIAGEICDPARDACCAATCDAFLAAGTVCRPSSGPCDPAEVCTGMAACPPDELAPAMTECRSGTGICDPAEVCDGLIPECPSDAITPDGSPCSDCTSGRCDTCIAGICPDLCGNGTVDTDAGEQCESGNDAACPGHCVNDCTCAYPRSCLEYLAAVPSLPNGIYTIDVDGAGTGVPFEVYCDMITDGGGWTLVGDYISNKELFSFDPTQHQLQNNAGGVATTAPPLLDGSVHGHIAYHLVPFTTTRLQCRSSVTEPWFGAETTLFQDWVSGDRGTYGSAHWAIIGGGNHGRSNHYICGYQVNTSGVYAGIAICNGPGNGFANHVVSMSFNPAPGSYGGGLAIGCNGSGITYGKDGSWQGRVWLR